MPVSAGKPRLIVVEVGDRGTKGTGPAYDRDEVIELTCLAVSGRDSGDTHQALATPEVVARMREMPHRRPAVARPDRLALVIRRR